MTQVWGTAGWRRGVALVVVALAVGLIAVMVGPRRAEAQATANGLIQSYLIKTQAGKFAGYYGGDGGPATSASLNAPNVAVADGAGNVYVSDTNNHVVRKIAAGTGIITTIAGAAGKPGFSGDGGPASQAQLNGPTAMVLDGLGNLLVSDSNNHAVRRIALSSLTITTLAGTGGRGGYGGDNGPATAALLNNPTGLAVDATGAVYIADTDNNIVRKVSGTTITTIAGTPGRSGFGGNGGLATASGALLAAPAGLAIDSANNLYIAEVDSLIVRRVTSTGALSTFAGTGQFGNSGDGGSAANARFSTPIGLAVDGAGNLLVSDLNAHVIRRIVISSRLISTVAGVGGQGDYGGDNGPATAARLNGPIGVSVDSGGNILIADTSNNLVRRVASATGTITTIAGSTNQGFSGDGGAATQARFALPRGVATDASGNVYVADTSNHVIRKVGLVSGTVTTVAGVGGQPGYSGDGGPATTARLNYPNGVVLDAAGNLFIADSSNHVVRKVDGATGVITTIAGSAGNPGFSGDGGSATNARLNTPKALALDTAGNLFIGDTSNYVVRRVAAASGGISTVAGKGGVVGSTGDNGPATTATLGATRSVAVDGNGNLFIADQTNSSIRRVAASTGIITTIAGGGGQGYSGDGGAATLAKLSAPAGIAVDTTGNVFIADTGNSVIRQISAATGLIATVAGKGGQPGYGGDGGAATSALLSSPVGIAVGAGGRLHFAEVGASVVRQLTPLPQSGWWWNASEGGRGYSLEVKSTGAAFFAAYMYRADGTSVWYAGTGQVTDGVLTLALEEYRGGSSLTNASNANFAALNRSLAARITFDAADRGTLVFSGSFVGATPVTTTITRYPFAGTSVFVSNLAQAPQTGWYFAGNEGGSGYFVEAQGNSIFLATYMYASDGSSRWYVNTPSSQTVSGASGVTLATPLQEYASGLTLTGGSASATKIANDFGQATFQFLAGNRISVALPGGRQVDLVRFTAF